MKAWQPKPGRTACAVPFCRRTCKALGEGHESICFQHFRAIDPARRRLYRRLVRKANALTGQERLTSEQVRLARRLIRMSWRMWEKMKAEAIEAAAGIG